MSKKLSKEQWEQRIREAGAGRYEFVRWAVDGLFGSHEKAVVRCSNDGTEWQAKSNNLSNGQGCPNCRYHKVSFSLRNPEELIIKKINTKEVISFIDWVDGYKNAHSKAMFECRIDGFRWIAPAHSIISHGNGCPQCSGNRRWSAEERVEQINCIENIEFVSWVGSYKNNKSKANVICKVDGFEWCASVQHLINNHSGCPSCSPGGYNPSKTGYLYALRSECGMYVKVGISNNPKRRHKQLERGTPFRFNLVEQLSGDGAKIAAMERDFHSKYERVGFTGFDGATEWLICTPQLLEELRELEDLK